MSQQNRSASNITLAAGQHNNAASHEGQFDDAVESIVQDIQSDNNTTRNHGGFLKIVFLDNGRFDNSPGNNAATNFICGHFSAIYGDLSRWGKRRVVDAVYEALINDGYSFVVVNQYGFTETAQESRALEYIQRKLREG